METPDAAALDDDEGILPMKAWTFQDHRAKLKLGSKAAWSVGWLTPEGKRRSKRIGSKSMAGKYAQKLGGQLSAGIYQDESRKSWVAFREEYETKIMARMEPGTRQSTRYALNHFERIVEPVKLQAIKTQRIDEFVAKRRMERGSKGGSTVSPATVNKELRHLKAVLRVAHDWGYLPTVPKVRMLKEPKKLPRYVTPEHFAAMYEACDTATMPKGLPYLAADWWRAMLTFIYMTGWRIREPLYLRREDLDLDAGTAITRHGDNKGKRDDLVPLHPIVVDHLRKLVSFDSLVFPWYHNERSLWSEFAKIQQAADIHLDCRDDHEHTAACHLYGFHDLRRAFATVNAETMSPDALQTLMRHKSYSTTQRYVNLARQINRAVEGLYVPPVLRQPRKAN